jgi:hypothetical protein
VACTVDTCEDGECRGAVDHGACDAGRLCHPFLGCLDALGWLCETCEDGEGCAYATDLCAHVDGLALCLLPCAVDDDCPAGFSCAAAVSPDGEDLGAACVPDGECCWDADGDGAGAGAGCALLDCDESSVEVREGANELCNGVDDDCDTVADDHVVDCPDPGCAAADGGGFEMTPWICVDEECEPSAPVGCGPYTCDEDSIACAGGCSDETTCLDEAHCDPVRGVCLLDMADGSWCLVDGDCESGNCGAGVCCAAGQECCPLPGAYESAPCGSCSEGYRDRVCTESFTWSAYSGCWGVDCTPSETTSCGNCGTRTCTSWCTWDTTCDFPDGAVDEWEYNGIPDYSSYLGVVWDSGGTPLTIQPTIHYDFGADFFHLEAWETAWPSHVMEPFVRLTVPSGQTYSLSVSWTLFSDSVMHVEPTVHVSCSLPSCTGTVYLGVTDTSQSENMWIYIEVRAQSMGSCSPYTLHIDA